MQNEIEKEKPNSSNKKTMDEKSIKSKNSYHYSSYNYNNYVNESFSDYNHNEEKEEKHHCDCCNKSIDYARVFNYLGDDYCFTCCPDEWLEFSNI